MHRVSRALRGALSQQVGQVRFAGTEGWTKPASLEFPSVTGDAKRRTVTVLPGDGVGPEVIAAAQEAIAATGAPIEWEQFKLSGLPGSSGYVNTVPKEVIESIARNKVCLKGGFYTAVGGGVSSLNVQIRKELDLFAHVCHAYDFPGIKSRHKDVDVVIVRENTEGEYAGLEHEVVPGVVESIKVITEPKSRRLAHYAFEYALVNGRKKVTCVHKANIMKLTDGLFLKVCGEVAKLYPTIQYDSIIVDNACMQMASKPQQFDVLVTPNLYGNIVDNVGAGLTGGAGFLPGGSIGQAAAVFEQGASAGNVGIQNAGKGTANPVAVMLASAMMLKHMKLPAFAHMLEDAVFAVLGAGKVRTADMGGSNTTKEFAGAVVDYIRHLQDTDKERN